MVRRSFSIQKVISHYVGLWLLGNWCSSSSACQFMWLVYLYSKMFCCCWFYCYCCCCWQKVAICIRQTNWRLDCGFVLGERLSVSRGLICRFVVWSLVAGKMWGFGHDLGVVGRVNQVTIRYGSDIAGMWSVDWRMAEYARWLFVMGVALTREYCI